MFKQYLEFCGTRSLVFQAIFLTWLVACIGILAALIATGPSGIEWHRFTTLASSVCSIFLLLVGCLPLGIAAIASLKR